MYYDEEKLLGYLDDVIFLSKFIVNKSDVKDDIKNVKKLRKHIKNKEYDKVFKKEVVEDE